MRDGRITVVGPDGEQWRITIPALPEPPSRVSAHERTPEERIAIMAGYWRGLGYDFQAIVKMIGGAPTIVSNLGPFGIPPKLTPRPIEAAAPVVTRRAARGGRR